MKVTSLITRRGVFVFVFALVLATASSIIAWTGPTQSPPNGNVAAPLNTGATAQTKTGDLNITGASGLWATGVGSDNGYCIGTDCITAWSQAGGGGGSSQWTTTGNDIYYNTGNVGIGMTTPVHRLDVQGGWVRFNGNSTGALQFEDQTTFHRQAFNELRFWDWQTGEMVTFNDGNVGIGTASPGRRLHLEESGQFVQMLWRAGTGSNKDLIMHYGENTTAGNEFRFGRYTRAGVWEANPVTFDMDAPSGALTLDGSGNFSVIGNVTAAGYFHSSDATLKKDISTFSRGLDVIKRLRGVTFSWKKDDAPAAGVIAQEVEQVMPEAVHTDERGLKSVDYDQLIAPMIEAIKEQQKQIETQQQEIASLKHEVESLKARQ